MISKLELKQILRDQKAEFDRTDPELFTRTLEPSLKNLLHSSKLVKVVLGVRRSGKSTLCKQSVGDELTAYVNFDDERLASIEAADLNKIFEILNIIYPNFRYVFFDEIQNIEKWELFINRLHRLGLNILVTGSNGKLLGKDLATHLTGRQVAVNLRPLIFKEYVYWKLPQFTPIENSLVPTSTYSEIRRHFDMFFELGGFPDVLRGEPQKVYLQELFDKIISRDIVQRFKVRDAKILKEIALYLIQNSSQKTSFENLKNIYKLKSLTTAKKYCDYLVDVFLIEDLRGYSYKLTERSTSQRKTYSCDLGMMKALWSKPTIDLGAKLETLVFLELRARGAEIYYLNENKVEVDFCIVNNGKPTSLIQVCYDISDPKTQDREVRALVTMAEKYKVHDLQIVTMEEESQMTASGRNIKVTPAYKFCLDSDFI
jgi:uncharacterized protein